MDADEHGHTPELEQVRRLLFPHLPPAEGWARIDAAIEGASDPARTEAIERLASGLDAALLARLRALREDA